MSARQRSLSESLGGTQPKAFAIATSRIFVCCTFHKRHSLFMLAKSRGILPQNAQRAEKPENKGVDKTAIRRDTFRVRCPVFRRTPRENRSKKQHPKEFGRKCMQGCGGNPQYAPILLPISYHSKPKMSRASPFSISISPISVNTGETFFCRSAVFFLRRAARGLIGIFQKC